MKPAHQVQGSLFDLPNLAATVQFPPAPALVPHTDWPFPGMTPEDSARAALAISAEYHEVLVAIVQSQGGAKLIDKEILALVPSDWRELLGKYAHGSIGDSFGRQRDIEVDYVHHDGGGHHFTYRALPAGTLRRFA